MPPDPSGMASPSVPPSGFTRIRSRQSGLGDAEHDWPASEVAFQQMPSSPVLPAVSSEEGTFIGGDYFSPSIKTTSAPLPPTADAALGLYRDELNSGPSTPLTSISSSSSFADSSASVAHTALTSIYSLSPPLSPAHRPTSHPSQEDYHGRSFSHLQHTAPYQLAEQRALPRLEDERVAGFGSTPSLPSTFTPVVSHGPTPQRGSHHQDSGSHLYSSRVPSRSSPSLLQQTRILSQSNAHHLDLFSRPRIHPPYPPRASLWQTTFGHSQQTHGHQRQQPSTSGVVPAASSQQWAAQSSTKPQSSGIPNASSSNFSPAHLFPSNRFAAPTGLQYGLQGSFLGTSIARDALLAYAHRLYNNPTSAPPFGLTTIPHQSDPNEGTPSPVYYRQLLSLLESIRSQHPQHLPTLLLLSCVHFSVGDHDACLRVCLEILDIDSNYVEAMSNIGMVFKARGAHRDAENMWLKATRLRPTYWDAIDNLLHVLCEPVKLQDGTTSTPRFHDALEVLEYVLNILIGPDGLLLVFVPPAHLHRLQNLLSTSGNIRAAISQDPRAGLHDQTRAIELLLCPPGSLESSNPLCFRDFVIASTIIGILGSPSTKSSTLGAIADALGVDPARVTHRMLERGIDWLGLVHQAGQKLVGILLHEGDGALPMVLLTPEMTARIPETLFSAYAGIFPGLCVRASYEDYWRPAPGVSDSAANTVTSTILLSLAKLLQSRDSKHIPYLFGSDKSLPRSLSLVLMLYYLALSLNPTPSTYNNMGIIFYTVKHTANTTNAQGQIETINGVLLAQMYYKKGLEMDPEHAHLLTNYGSLLKDQGRPLEAISMYKKALGAKPDFDVALANLANVVKDSGGIVESIEYYQRALAVSPDFPDVVCGLVNALSSICDWRGDRGSTGSEPVVDDQLAIVFRATKQDFTPHGWMGKLEKVTKKQLLEGYVHGAGIVRLAGPIEDWLARVEMAHGSKLTLKQYRRWKKTFGRFYTDFDRQEKAINETGFMIRFVEFMNRIIQQRWYNDLYVEGSSAKAKQQESSGSYKRIRLPRALGPPNVPSVLPFHTFTYSLDTRDLRLVAYRNALRISYNTLTAPWLPETVFRPPPAPSGRLNIGYVSSDFSNHPLAHLMLSVFGMHDRERHNVYVYATTSSDNSYYRQRIEDDSQYFRDVSKCTTQSIVKQIVQDQIHILVNLGGYTKGARNDVFAARPCPIQISMVGYAGTSGASWCDYILGDKHACPKELFEPYHTAIRRKKGQETFRMQDHFLKLSLETDMPYDDADPESLSPEWSFTEKYLHMPHSYFVTDHRQAFQEQHFDPNSSAETTWLHEERLRHQMRSELFPDLPELAFPLLPFVLADISSSDAVIFACFSQLYKICPSAFFVWLNILQRVPGAILWLLRFPSAGEDHLMRVAVLWGGEEVASRVRFTDIARKDVHVSRCRVADLFLDTFQCNAHTIAADVLWTGTPILTWPKERLKMCTRVASSIAYATGFGDSMVARDEHTYENRAVALAQSVSYRSEPNEEGRYDRRGSGELIELRRSIFLNRNKMPLFDTVRWTRNLEKGFQEIWKRWVAKCAPPWQEDEDEGCVSIIDEDPFFSS